MTIKHVWAYVSAGKVDSHSLHEPTLFDFILLQVKDVAQPDQCTQGIEEQSISWNPPRGEYW